MTNGFLAISSIGTRNNYKTDTDTTNRMLTIHSPCVVPIQTTVQGILA